MLSRSQKNKISSVLKENYCKTKRKSLEEKLKEFDNSLSAQFRLSVHPHLAGDPSFSAKKPKGALNANAHAKHEILFF